MLIHSFKKNQLFFIIFIILLAATLRLYNLGKQSLWLDEAYSVMMSKNLVNLWLDQIKDSSPPLYYTILHFWILFLGQTESSLRLLSSIFGILFIPLLFVVGTNIFGKKTGIFASLIAAISPYHIYYSQEARAYSLLALLSLASFFILYLGIKENRGIFWITYVIINILCLYTHNYGVLLLISEICFCIFYCQNKHVLTNIIISQICIFIAFLPRIPILFKQALMDMNPWISTPKIGDLISSFKYFCLLSWRTPMTPLLSLALKITIPLFAVVFVIGLLGRKKENFFLFIYFFIPLGLAFLISLRKPIYVAGRYDMLIFPGFCLIIGVGLDKIKANYLQFILLTVIILATSFSLFNYYFVYRKSNDKFVSQYIQRRIEKNDIIVATELSIVAFEYYWKQDFQPQLFQSPNGPRSALVRKAFVGGEEYINLEIKKLMEKIYPLLTRTNKLWILYYPFTFSDRLLEVLEKEFENTAILHLREGDNLNQISKICIFKKR